MHTPKAAPRLHTISRPHHLLAQICTISHARNPPFLHYTTMAQAMGVDMYLGIHHRRKELPIRLHCKASAIWGSVPQDACKWMKK